MKSDTDPEGRGEKGRRENTRWLRTPVLTAHLTRQSEREPGLLVRDGQGGGWGMTVYVSMLMTH